VSVPGVSCLVQRTVPGNVEEEVEFVRDLFLWEVLSPQRGEGGNRSWKPCCWWVDLLRGTNEPMVDEAALVANQTGNGGEGMPPSRGRESS